MLRCIVVAVKGGCVSGRARQSTSTRRVWRQMGESVCWAGSCRVVRVYCECVMGKGKEGVNESAPCDSMGMQSNAIEGGVGVKEKGG